MPTRPAGSGWVSEVPRSVAGPRQFKLVLKPAISVTSESMAKAEGVLWLGTGAASSGLETRARGGRDAARPDDAFTGWATPAAGSGCREPSDAWRTVKARSRSRLARRFIVDPQEWWSIPCPPCDRAVRSTARNSPRQAIDFRGARQLAIDYSAPSFVQPSRVLFKYQLEGYDESRISAERAHRDYGELLPAAIRSGSPPPTMMESGMRRSALAVVQEPILSTRIFSRSRPAAIAPLS